jgi:protein-disulfide isomerase
MMAVLSVPINSADHVQGNLQAPATLVEYGDYECPACGLAFPIVKAVQEHFGKQLCFVFRHFPLTQIHPNAESAAETAEFAGAHDRFWEMHDGLFENQTALGLSLYLALAKALGLSGTALAEALEDGTFRPKVRNDFMEGLHSGVNGTPTFFINGRRHDGAYSFHDLIAAIEAQLVQTEVAR